jgi:hypothetical protein
MFASHVMEVTQGELEKSYGEDDLWIYTSGNSKKRKLQHEEENKAASDENKISSPSKIPRKKMKQKILSRFETLSILAKDPDVKHYLTLPLT